MLPSTASLLSDDWVFGDPGDKDGRDGFIGPSPSPPPPPPPPPPLGMSFSPVPLKRDFGRSGGLRGRAPAAEA